MKVTVEHEFWQVFPEAQISVLVVKGIDNSVDESKDSYFKSLLDKGAKRAEDFIPDENFTQNEVIQEWRQAFSQFKTKKGARSSIEALLKRLVRGGNFIQSILWLISITVSRCLMQFLVAVRIWIRLSEVFI